MLSRNISNNCFICFTDCISRQHSKATSWFESYTIQRGHPALLSTCIQRFGIQARITRSASLVTDRRTRSVSSTTVGCYHISDSCWRGSASSSSYTGAVLLILAILLLTIVHNVESLCLYVKSELSIL